jgi:hypothetical protein
MKTVFAILGSRMSSFGLPASKYPTNGTFRRNCLLGDFYLISQHFKILFYSLINVIDVVNEVSLLSECIGCVSKRKLWRWSINISLFKVIVISSVPPIEQINCGGN